MAATVDRDDGTGDVGRLVAAEVGDGVGGLNWLGGAAKRNGGGEGGRTFPNQRANAGPDQSYGLSDHSREGAPTHAASPRAIHRF